MKACRGPSARRSGDGRHVLYGLAGSRLVSVAREMAAANEVFADRSYHDGSLTPRGKPAP